MSKILDLRKTGDQKIDDISKVRSLVEQHSISNFIVEDRVEAEYIDSLINGLACEKCNKSTSEVARIESEYETVSMLRCGDCQDPRWLFFSSREITSGDLVILCSPPWDPAWQQQFNDLKCYECGVSTESNIRKETESMKFHDRFFPYLLECNKCRRSLPLVFWNNPKHYYDTNVNIATQLVAQSTIAALIFHVSAIEAYMQKVFVIQGLFEAYLVDKRRISFQNIEDLKKVFKNRFDIDPASSVDAKSWEVLIRGFKLRHLHIHNSGYDKDWQYQPISEDFVAEFQAASKKLVTSLNDLLVSSGFL